MLEGELVLIMDVGETTVRAGDIVVQRGTNHGWANRTDKNCRIAFILIDGVYEDGLDKGMKLATLDNGARDGWLVVVSRDLNTAVSAGEALPTPQAALEDWASAREETPGDALAAALNAGHESRRRPAPFVSHRQALAPLPRAYQWLDASAFPSHGALMSRGAFNITHPETDRPLMYRTACPIDFSGRTPRSLSPAKPMASTSRGEFGVITDDVPAGRLGGCGPRSHKAAGPDQRLVAAALAPAEMKTGFGWIRAKPACSMAPVARSRPTSWGEAWADARVQLRLAVDWNGERFGNAHAGAMEVGFHDLIAHAASTRALCAGTIIGSGTVANFDHETVGSSCIAERRGAGSSLTARRERRSWRSATGCAWKRATPSAHRCLASSTRGGRPGLTGGIGRPSTYPM
ncbi:fumarylacetoacetate hydrolase family protein [Caulobacter segnis]